MTECVVDNCQLNNKQMAKHRRIVPDVTGGNSTRDLGIYNFF